MPRTLIWHFILRFLQGIWLHTQREEEKILLAWGLPQRNCHSHNDVLYKCKSKSSLAGWRHRLLWHSCRWSARGYISPIHVVNRPRLRASNVDWFTKWKWLYTVKARNRSYPAQTITNVYYADDILILANLPCLCRISAAWSGEVGWRYRALCQCKQNSTYD